MRAADAMRIISLPMLPCSLQAVLSSKYHREQFRGLFDALVQQDRGMCIVIHVVGRRRMDPSLKVSLCLCAVLGGVADDRFRLIQAEVHRYHLKVCCSHFQLLLQPDTGALLARRLHLVRID